MNRRKLLIPIYMNATIQTSFTRCVHYIIFTVWAKCRRFSKFILTYHKSKPRIKSYFWLINSNQIKFLYSREHVWLILRLTICLICYYSYFSAKSNSYRNGSKWKPVINLNSTHVSPYKHLIYYTLYIKHQRPSLGISVAINSSLYTGSLRWCVAKKVWKLIST